MKSRRLKDRQALLQREFLDRVDRLAVPVGLAIDRDDLVGPGLEQFGKGVLAEGLLSHHDQAHAYSPFVGWDLFAGPIPIVFVV